MRVEEEVWVLKREVEELKRDLSALKRAVVNVPEFGDRVQKNLWGF